MEGIISAVWDEIVTKNMDLLKVTMVVIIILTADILKMAFQ